MYEGGILLNRSKQVGTGEIDAVEPTDDLINLTRYDKSSRVLCLSCKNTFAKTAGDSLTSSFA